MQEKITSKYLLKLSFENIYVGYHCLSMFDFSRLPVWNKVHIALPAACHLSYI